MPHERKEEAEQSRAGQIRSGRVRSGQVRSGLARGWYGRARQVQVGRSSSRKARQGKARQGKTRQGKVGGGAEERVGAGQARPGIPTVLAISMADIGPGRATAAMCSVQVPAAVNVLIRHPPSLSAHSIRFGNISGLADVGLVRPHPLSHCMAFDGNGPGWLGQVEINHSPLIACVSTTSWGRLQGSTG